METSFSDLSLLVEPGRVMTPHRSTEALVEAALERIGNRRMRVADVGTGTGAIALALARRAPQTKIWATDVSPDALRVSRLNVERLGLADRVHLVEGDLLEPIRGRLDLVVANLPYLPEYLRPLRPEYASEPAEAVFVAGDGLAPYRRLLDQAEERLATGGAVLIQFHRRVLEAGRDELGRLRARLDGFALAAA